MSADDYWRVLTAALTLLTAGVTVIGSALMLGYIAADIAGDVIQRVRALK